MLASPIPAAAPTASHHRPSPVRRSFTPNSAISDHSSMSAELVASMCETTRTYAESAVARAVNSCAPRPPPNSRAISVTTTTVATPSRVAATRRPLGVSPNNAVDTRASHGVIGGLST